MKYNDYIQQITKQGYHLDKNNIFRDKKGKPKCFNPVFQDLVIRQQDGEQLSYREENLFGQLIITLVQIISNNHHFILQDPDIKDECRTEAYVDILNGLVKYFDRNRGSTAYSYAFRLGYVAGIHVLERMNERKELIEKLTQEYTEMLEENDN